MNHNHKHNTTAPLRLVSYAMYCPAFYFCLRKMYDFWVILSAFNATSVVILSNFNTTSVTSRIHSYTVDTPDL